MSIIRQDIVTNIETRMKTILKSGGYHTNLGASVFVWRTVGVPASELPILIIKDSIDTKMGEGVSTPYSKDDWKLDIEIITLASDGNASDTALRQAVADIYKAIGTDDTWSGKASSTFLESDEIGLIKQEDKTVIGAVVKFYVQYRTSKYAES